SVDSTRLNITTARTLIVEFFTSLSSEVRFLLFPYTTLFRSERAYSEMALGGKSTALLLMEGEREGEGERESRLFSSALGGSALRSEEHTSELQSRFDLVCRLLLEKKHERSTHQRPKAREERT